MFNRTLAKKGSMALPGDSGMEHPGRTKKPVHRVSY